MPTLEVSLDRTVYRFQTEVRVRLSETDAVGVVFFGSFSNYLDVGRMDYINHLGLQKLGGPVRDLIPGAVVRAHLEFESPARYNDLLRLHVRLAALGRTSYTFHTLVAQERTGALVARGALTLVWLDAAFRPLPLPDAFRQAVLAFEGPHVRTEA